MVTHTNAQSICFIHPMSELETIGVASSPPRVNEEMFQAYLEGNDALPQMYGAIKISVLDVALRQPTDWLQFVESTWSSDQITAAGEAIAVSHGVYGVRHMPSDSAGIHDKAIPASRMQKLWQDAKIGCINVLLKYSGYPEQTHISFRKLTEENALLLNDFFADPHNGERVALLSDILRTARASLQDSESVHLQKAYKAVEVRKHYMKTHRMKNRDITQERSDAIVAFRRFTEKYVSDSFGIPQESDEVRNFFASYIW